MKVSIPNTFPRVFNYSFQSPCRPPAPLTGCVPRDSEKDAPSRGQFISH
jgi:hypothetical protein